MARANYIAQDRTDIAFATKELGRGMSKPNKGNQKALKRLARYLIGRERESSQQIQVSAIIQTH